jgi:hypothetical protein
LFCKASATWILGTVHPIKRAHRRDAEHSGPLPGLLRDAVEDGVVGEGEDPVGGLLVRIAEEEASVVGKELEGS